MTRIVLMAIAELITDHYKQTLSSQEYHDIVVSLIVGLPTFKFMTRGHSNSENKTFCVTKSEKIYF